MLLAICIAVAVVALLWPTPAISGRAVGRKRLSLSRSSFYPCQSNARRLLLSHATISVTRVPMLGDELRRSPIPGEMVRSSSTCDVPGTWLGVGGAVVPLMLPSPGLLVPVMVLGVRRRNAGNFPWLAAATAVWALPHHVVASAPMRTLRFPFSFVSPLTPSSCLPCFSCFPMIKRSCKNGLLASCYEILFLASLYATNFL
jgi:hypothetical protein